MGVGRQAGKVLCGGQAWGWVWGGQEVAGFSCSCWAAGAGGMTSRLVVGALASLLPCLVRDWWQQH